MLPLIFAAAVTAAAQPCTTPQPGPINGQPWVCVNGGWLPPTVTPPPPPEPPPAEDVRFRVGRSYSRNTTYIYIAGVGQLADGTAILLAECLAVGDGCFAVGYLRAIPTNATAHDWLEAPTP